MIGHTSCIWENCPGTHPKGVGAFRAPSELKSLIAISSILVEPNNSDIPIGTTCPNTNQTEVIGHTTCIWKPARGLILRVWVHFEPNRSEKV